jgi:hypothetical protein
LISPLWNFWETFGSRFIRVLWNPFNMLASGSPHF